MSNGGLDALEEVLNGVRDHSVNWSFIRLHGIEDTPGLRKVYLH